jgi:single-strand DNA-binding protein
MFNKVILIGHLGQDPELRYTPAGQKNCRFSLATSKKFITDGEARERTEWHNIVAWNKLAEICSEYLHKGSQVFIEGEIQYQNYEKDGQIRYFTVINARTMKMLGRRDAARQDDQCGDNRAAGDEDFPF